MKRQYMQTLSQDPLLFHGAHIFEILALFENQSLLPESPTQGIDFVYTESAQELKNLKIRGESKSEAMATAKFYAEYTGMECCFKAFGYPIKDYANLVKGKTNYQVVLREDYGLTRDEAISVVNRVYELRGFIVEPTEEIFKSHFSYNKGSSTITFRFPQGLPGKLIRAVKPLGSVEKRVIESKDKRKALLEWASPLELSL